MLIKFNVVYVTATNNTPAKFELKQMHCLDLYTSLNQDASKCTHASKSHRYFFHDYNIFHIRSGSKNKFYFSFKVLHNISSGQEHVSCTNKVK